jgi:hypothetical protein
MAKGIYKRGEHQYLVRIRQNGRNISRTFEAYEQAREWREITVGQVTGRTYVDKERERRTTLAQVLARYREEVTPTKDGERQEKARLLAADRVDYPRPHRAVARPAYQGGQSALNDLKRHELALRRVQNRHRRVGIQSHEPVHRHPAADPSTRPRGAPLERGRGRPAGRL